ncbi:MAG: AAA family ATPase [Candidatus Binatia bacterium]|jgi:general secretion pathway protein A
MYCEFYQLTERPFNVTPDPKFLYLNARYREAIASLNYGITQRKGFVTLIGEAGTGKTTLLNKLLEDLDSKTRSVFIFNTNVTFEEMLEYIFAEFDLPVHNGKKLYMLQRLNTFLLDELRAGSNVALLIDEAQDLEFSVLEDLRLLSNLETAKEKILQIVLSGQPELGQKLSNPVLRQLRQRIGINCRLLPLSRDEITEYIQYRLQAAGCPDLKLFSREAVEQIYHFSRGIPRLVNVVCDNALVIGYALGKKRIGADLITEAAADLLSNEQTAEDLNTQPPPVSTVTVSTPSRVRWRPRLAVMALLLVAVAIGLLSGVRTMLQKQDKHLVAAPAEPLKLEVIRPGSQARSGSVEYPVARPDDTMKDVAAAVPEANPPAEAGSPSKMIAAAEAGPPTDAGNSAPGKGHESDGGVRVAVQQGDRPATAGVAAGGPGAARNGPEAAHDAAASTKGSEVAPAASEQGLAEEVAAAPQDRGRTVGAQAEEAALNTDGGEPVGEHKAREPAPAQVAAVADDTGMAGDQRSGRYARLEGMPFAEVVVRGGDSMSAIALRKYGHATYTILDLLKLANPDLRDINMITIGQKIRLPELGDGFPILSDGSGRYSLLVYSSHVGGRATAVQNALRSRGFDARVSQGSIGYQKPVFRVVISRGNNREELIGLGRQLQKLFREDTRIAQLGD